MIRASWIEGLREVTQCCPCDIEPEPSPAELEARDRYSRRSHFAISEEDARLARMAAGTPVFNRNN